ncbi:AAA family ATPase [Brevibacterium sp. ACRRH]|uniref:AAA family ATPase n=1 Tax=Brevibacterium sp. ACRRH TaxID=2918183 RepID=UPI001EF46D31|nr:AAA family ATPase [Brevibacterium sp. ACRRH]MCG7298908.1 phosphonate metabolism protein/1,5-bisphosphokinase (PRPP-forming) PhnN [Brevibacterium sp. ACRRH]
MTRSRTGVFVAVVGPSGTGKDSIIDGVQRVLASTHAEIADDFIFTRRYITRPKGNGEDHVEISHDDYLQKKKDGKFSLTWEAHGLSYALPCELIDYVKHGKIVVANISRGVLKELPDVFGNSLTVKVTTDESVRLERLLKRGREEADDVRKRLGRDDPAPEADTDLVIENNGSLDDAISTMSRFLLDIDESH